MLRQTRQSADSFVPSRVPAQRNSATQRNSRVDEGVRVDKFSSATRPKPRRGIALIFVLVVISMLTFSAYTFTRLMVAEREATMLLGRQIQAQALVDSGVAQMQYFLELEELVRQQQGGVYENPSWFQAIPVIDGELPAARGRFTVVAPRMDDNGYFGGIRFGLENESGRLNLNALNLREAGSEDDELNDLAATVGNGGDQSGGDQSGGGQIGGGQIGGGQIGGGQNGDQTGGGQSGGDQSGNEDESNGGQEQPEIDTSGRTLLMAVPGMTEDVADAILDWLDEDDEPREFGAEIDYYSSLNPPVAPKNGPIESIEELLMVRGITPDLLFGRDTNRNGIIDMHEADIPLTVDFGDGTLDRGWSALFTLYSMEKNTDSDGLPRVDLNSEDLETLHLELTEALNEGWATFIVAYRQSGPFTNDSPDAEAPGNQPLDFTRPAKFPITQVLDLVGVNVQAQLAEGEGTVVLLSPFSDEPLAMGAYLPDLMDKCTVNPEPVIPGRISINHAPYSVLLAIPGITEEIAAAIVSERDVVNADVDENLKHETWLLTRAIVTLDEMKSMMPFITAGGDVFRAQVVGYFDQGAISSRAEVVIDATAAMPRVVFWRDISHLGRGFGLETLGVVPY